MKNLALLSTFSVFAFCVVTASPSMAASPKLARKAGIWELTMTAPGMPPMVMEACVKPDDDVTDTMGYIGDKANTKCSKNSGKREGSKYTYVKDCLYKGEIRTATTSVFEGDFKSQYTETDHMDYDSPLTGHDEHDSVTSAKWLRPCDGSTPKAPKMQMETP